MFWQKGWTVSAAHSDVSLGGFNVLAEKLATFCIRLHRFNFIHQFITMNFNESAAHSLFMSKKYQMFTSTWVSQSSESSTSTLGKSGQTW